ncbi:MAG: class I SAM-dependent methyltransferase [Leptospiraceae bacterium]|nr:class I SAM-dependent methyltransferase [Leptospiraceae bacterium]
MGIYAERILPRCINRFMDAPDFERLRKRALRRAYGRVLELGFGSGLNLPFYPSAVESVTAVDPALLGRRLAADRIAACSFPVTFTDLAAHKAGSRIEAPDGSFDTVVTTWTLCTVPDAVQALRELRRVLKRDGLYLFVEHGRAPTGGVAFFQDVLTPIQKWIAGGCHLNRRIDTLIAGCFRFERLHRFYIPGPRVGTYMYLGEAR